jgi:hypothetical protein
MPVANGAIGSMLAIVDPRFSADKDLTELLRYILVH